MLSNASKYSINAVLYLAVESSEARKIGLKEIAEAIGAPSPFLAKQLQILARNGIVSSMKGPTGGFFLTEENRQVKLITIIDNIDGLSRLNTCVLGLKSCNASKPCPIHHAIEPFRNELLYHMSQTSIDSYAAQIKRGNTFLIE